MKESQEEDEDKDDKDNEIDGDKGEKGNKGSEQMSGSEEDSSSGSGEGPGGLAGFIFNLSGVIYLSCLEFNIPIWNQCIFTLSFHFRVKKDQMLERSSVNQYKLLIGICNKNHFLIWKKNFFLTFSGVLSQVLSNLFGVRFLNEAQKFKY